MSFFTEKSISTVPKKSCSGPPAPYGKKVALAAFSCAGGRLIDMEVIFGSLCVPMHLSIPCGPCQHSFISQAPKSQPQKHTPGVIQSSPHTHPRHKKNKMGDVTPPSPDSYISTPPSPPESLRWLSCFCHLANLACVFFWSCVHFRFGANLTTTKPTTNAQILFGQSRVP